jgi:hypothetical protein
MLADYVANKEKSGVSETSHFSKAAKDSNCLAVVPVSMSF